MKRKHFTFVSVSWLLLCIAMIALWARSYFILDVWGRDWHGVDCGISSAIGSMEVELDNARLLDGLHHDSGVWMTPGRCPECGMPMSGKEARI